MDLLDWTSGHWIELAMVACAFFIVFCVVMALRQHEQEPASSGTYGKADIATPAVLAAEGLTAGKAPVRPKVRPPAPGEGYRLCEDGAGNIIRYTGRRPGKEKAHPNSISICGPPRCGKQATLLTALIAEHQGSMVILDPKGELTSTTLPARKKLGPVKIICPIRDGVEPEVLKVIDDHFRSEGSELTTDSFNILDSLDPESDGFETMCANIAMMLIKADDNETKNSGYFTGTATMAVTGVIAHLLEYRPDTATLDEVADIISTERLFLIAEAAMDADNKYVKRMLSRFASHDGGYNPRSDKQVEEFQSTARAQMKFMFSRAMEKALSRPAKPWNFMDLKNGEKPMTIFVVIPIAHIGVMAEFSRLLITAITDTMLSGIPGRHHVTIVADEFARMGRIDKVLPIFEAGGGAGVSMIPVFQAVSQMTGIWGKDWETMKEGCDLRIYFPPKADKETLEEIARFVGTKTIMDKSFSYDPNSGETKGINYNAKGQPVLDPHEIPAMGGNCLITAPGIVKDVIIGTTKFYRTYPDIDALCNLNPWQT